MIFDRTIYFLNALNELNLLNTFIIESSYVKLTTYKCIKILYLYAPQLQKNHESTLIDYQKIFNIDIEQVKILSNSLFIELREKIRKEFLTCNYIIDNKLKVKLDNKSNLKKYFNDKSILPLTFNIGFIGKLLSECEFKELFIQSNYINYIIIKIIKFISNYCNLYKNKFFILKDANGTRGINITGFNCFDDYDKTNYEEKISYLTKLFDEENKTMETAQNRAEHIYNIKKILKKELVIQEYIQSPQIKDLDTKYNYKSRIFVIIYQQKSQNGNISQLYSYVHKGFTLDLMKYNKINRYNFYNKTGKDYLFISNILNISKTSNEIDHDQFSFNPNEKLKEFIDKFNIHINKINKFYDGIMVDDNDQFVNNNIYKILAIDIIFDINDNYNIKMLEINTEGAVYVEDVEKGILKLIYNNDDSSFIKADTTFNYDEEVTYSDSFDNIYCINKFNETKDNSLIYKNKYLKYKNKYLNIKNNL